MSRHFGWGILTFLFFLFGDGARMVYVAYYLYININPFTLIFCSSLISLIFSSFNSYSSNSPNQNHLNRPPNRAVYIYFGLINLSTMTSWVTAYIAIKFIQPAIFSMLAVSVGPLILSIAKYSQTGVLGLTLALLGIFIATLSLKYFPIIATQSESHFYTSIIGTTLSAICGISIFINTALSKKLSLLNQPPLKINTFRWLLLFLISTTICFKKNLFMEIINNFFNIVIFSLFFVFLVQLSLQFSIRTLGSELITIGIALAPTASLLITLIIPYQETTTSQLPIILTNALCLILFGLHFLRPSLKN